MQKLGFCSLHIGILFSSFFLTLSVEAQTCAEFFTQKLTWPSHRQEPHPIVSKATPEKYLNSPELPVEGAHALTRFNPEQIYTLAHDPVALDQLLESYRDPYAPSEETSILRGESLLVFRQRVQLMARIMSARLYSSAPASSRAYNLQEFYQLAKDSGLNLESVDVAYRFDQRSPQEIVQDSGFFPNPDKRFSDVSLLEHSLSDSLGGFFVSSTLKENNLAILPSRMFSDLVKDQNSAQAQAQALGVGTSELGLVISLRKAYEYKIESVQGVRARSHGIASEAEFISPYIVSDQIREYREVQLVEYLSPEFTQQLQAEKNQDLSSVGQRQYIWATFRSKILRRTQFGSWQPFPESAP